MNDERSFRRARLAVLVLWLALAIALLGWSLAGRDAMAGITLAVLTVGPLLLPVAGLALNQRRTYRWAPLTLTPGLAWSLTELVANPGARGLAALSALLSFLALAAVVAALRTMPRH